MKPTNKLLFFLFLFVLPSFAQQYDSLDSYIDKWQDQFRIPGITVGIVKNDSIVFLKGYGVRSTITKQPVTPATIFEIASLTKAFTAVSVAILVDEGKVNWDDKVIDYLPWFRMYDPYVTREITIRDLLSHRSGLATFDGDLLWYGTDYSTEDAVKRIRYLPLKNGFRARYGYQNIMFMTAGLLVEKVSGKSLSQFMRERIFIPLAMTSTNASTSEYSEQQDWTLPHVKGKPISFLNYDNSGGAAFINSSAVDLLKWLRMWINRGVFNGKRIISEKSYTVITSAQLPLFAGDGNEIYGTHFRNYGLGWFLWDYSGRKIIEHSGGLPGAHSKAAFVPEDSLGVIILCNEINYFVDPLLSKILDMFMNTKDTDYASASFKIYEKNEAKKHEDEKQLHEARLTNTSPSLPLQDYAGTYEDKMYGKADIKLSGNKLQLTMIPTAALFTSEMEHWHLNTFRIKFNDPYLPEGFVTFDFKPDGKVSGFKIHLPNPDFNFYNLNFIKQ